MTPKQQMNTVKLLVMDETKKERKKTINAIYATFAMCLKDKWDWPVEDIIELMKQTDEQFKMVLEKFVKVEDFEEWAKEFGII